MGFIEENKTESLAIEKQVLGGLLADDVMYKVIHTLKPHHFSSKKLSYVYQACIDLYRQKIPIDTVTLYNKVKDVLSASEISELSHEISSAAKIEYHVAVLVELWTKRQLHTLGEKLKLEKFPSHEDLYEVAGRYQDEFYQIIHSHFSKGYEKADAIAGEVLENYKKVKKYGMGSILVPSGFTDLDKLILGFKKGESTIIAARPSMGKTGFALSIARRIKKPVGMFSLEMSKSQLVTRLLSAELGIPMNEIVSASLSRDDEYRLAEARKTLSELPLYIDDTSAITTDEFVSKAKRMKTEQGVELIIVDYLQLMRHPDADIREQEISRISQTLKDVAKKLDIPVIALAQLNRALEGRTNKEPMLSDLRESGAIEQDADVVMFLFRPEFYGYTVYEDIKNTEGYAKLIIGKNRNGALGAIPLSFQKQTAQFHDFSIYSQLGQYES